MKNVLYIIILLITSTQVFGQSNPIYGSSSSRGVSVFDVPHQASIGSTEVKRFSRFSTGTDRFRPRDAIRTPNPLRFYNRASNSLPKATYHGVKRMEGQVRSRAASTRYSARVNPSYMRPGSNSMPDFTSDSTYNYASKNDLSTRYPLRISKSPNQMLKKLRSSSSLMAVDKNIRLLQGNRRGRLSYSKVGIDRSILNRKNKITSSRLSTNKYLTSSILSNR